MTDYNIGCPHCGKLFLSTDDPKSSSNTPRKDQLIGASIAKINERLQQLEDGQHCAMDTNEHDQERIEELENRVNGLRALVKHLDPIVKTLEAERAANQRLQERVEKLEQNATDAVDRSLVYDLRGRIEKLETFKAKVAHLEALEYRVEKLEQNPAHRNAQTNTQTTTPFLQHSAPLATFDEKLNYIIETLSRQGYSWPVMLQWLAAYADIDQAHAVAQEYEDNERAGDLDRGR